MPVTVSTVIDQNQNGDIVADCSQHKVWYSNGLYWAFFYNTNAFIGFATSATGKAGSWSSMATLSSSDINDALGFDVVVSGTTMTYVYWNSSFNPSNQFWWAQATLNSNGTVTFTTNETAVTITGYSNETPYNPSVTVDSSGNVWVSWRIQAANALVVLKHSGGSWAVNHAFSPGGSTDDIYGQLIALTSGKIAAIYTDVSSSSGPVKTYLSGWSGSAWSSPASPPSVYNQYMANGVAIGDTVHFTGSTGTGFSGGASKYWSSAYPFSGSITETTFNASIFGDTAISTNGTDLVAVYSLSNQTEVVYRLSKDGGSTWSNEAPVATGVQFWSSTDGINLSMCPAMNQNTAFMIWEESNADGGAFGSGPWPVTFASVDISTTPTVTTIFVSRVVPPVTIVLP